MIKKHIIMLYILIPLAIVYVLAAPTKLPDFDSGEFISIAAKGGIAHPPGYPLLSLLFRFASFFDKYVSIVFVLSIVSVTCTLLSAMLIYLIIYEYTENHIATALGIYGAFLSCVVWRAATATEPFALNLFQTGVCLYTLWKILTSQNQKNSCHQWFAILGMNFGLGFCNHHSLAFMLPFAILVWLHQTSGKLRCLLWFSAGSLTGLTPLIYFFTDYAQTGSYIWGDWTQPFKRIWIHLFRVEYGTLSLAADSSGTWYNGLILFLNTLPKDLSVIFFVFMLAGGYVTPYYIKTRKYLFPKISVFHFGIGLSILLTGGIFISMFKIGHSEWEKSVAERFFALPVILLSFPIAHFSLWVQEKWSKKNMQILMTVVFILFHALWQWPNSERRNETFYEKHIQNALHIVEDNAVIITTADASFFGLLYGQQVLNLKPDAIRFQVELWNTGWYVKQFLSQAGLELKPSYKEIALLLPDLIAKRPVYILDKHPGINPLIQNAYPIGPLLRLTGKDEPMPSPYDLYNKNLELYRNKMQLPDMEKTSHFNTWEIGLLHYYQRTWKILADTFDNYGDKKMAAVCRKYEDYFAPPR